MFYVYTHSRPDGTPFYVGKGSGRRAHRLVGATRSVWHQRVVSKYGEGNIIIQKFLCQTEAEAFSLEVAKIAEFRALGYELCNFTDGGEGTAGLVVSQETRAKMSASHKGKKQTPEAVAKTRASHIGAKRSPEACKRIREALLALPDEVKARVREASKQKPEGWRENLTAARIRRAATQPVTEETRRKLSAAWKNKTVAEQEAIRQKMSVARKGRKVSAETRKKLSERVVTAETRAKLSAALKGRTFSPEHMEKIRITKMKKKVQAISRMSMAGQGAGPAPIAQSINNTQQARFL